MHKIYYKIEDIMKKLGIGKFCIHCCKFRLFHNPEKCISRSITLNSEQVLYVREALRILIEEVTERGAVNLTKSMVKRACDVMGIKYEY